MMYEVVCVYDDILMGQVSYTIASNLTMIEAKMICLGKADYMIKEMK